MKKVHIIGGGTVCYLASHFFVGGGLAKGSVARMISNLAINRFAGMDTHLHLTTMADKNAPDSCLGRKIETNQDVEDLIDKLIADEDTKVIFMTAAMTDWGITENLKYGPRLSTHNSDPSNSITITLKALPKVVNKIRKTRKDIFLVAFKQTSGYTEDNQYLAGLKLLKASSANLVLANDDVTRLNMVIVPEEARYHVTTDRFEAIKGLVEMAKLRSQLTFTRSTVLPLGQMIVSNGKSEVVSLVSWDSNLVYPTLKTVVDHCVKRGAYKIFNGSTAGHFACKINENTFLTSIRKTNFNEIEKTGLVKVITDGPNKVIAYGAKPSVGGQSQRIVFSEHVDYDCIVHFHSPIKPNSMVSVASQRERECGSHECGLNTSRNLKKFGNLSAVYLDNHGPNIVFHHSIDPQEVINFIEANFDLEDKTGGLVNEKLLVG